MNTKKTIKKRKKRRLRKGRLCILLVLMSICVGLLITGITIVGNAFGDFLQGFQEDSSTNQQASENKNVVYTKDSIIVIDAGHGGYDGGCEYKDANEKTITLEIALKTGALLEDAGYKVIYTRTTDIALGTYEYEDLSNRVNLGVQAGGSVFVSLHLNITEDIQERVYGFEVYANDRMKESETLAESVIENLEDLQYSTSRGVLNGDGLHLVIENPLPAILVELGFLDDDMDRAYLTSDTGQNKIAKALAEAIMKQYT